jgi:hypothetical protein
MGNIILAPPAHHPTVNEIECGKDDAGHWDHCEEIDLVPGVEKNGGENNSGNGSGSSDGIIEIVLAVFDERVERGNQYGSDIEDQKIGNPVGPEKLLEIPLTYSSKTIQHKHIDDQMCPVCMKECMQEHPGILLSFNDLVRIELIFIDQAMLTKSDY